MKKPISQHTFKATDLAIGYSSSKGETLIAQDISLAFEKGQLVGLIGINGSGKSTLLRTLAGLQVPIRGDIQLGNVSLTNIPPEQLAKQLSVVLTKQPISKNLSVIELVAIGRQPYTNWLGALTAGDKEAIKEALQQTDTYALKDKKCYELSDGQLQRVLIARALAQDTQVILLDEPLTHLDLHHKASLLKLLTHIAHQQHKTVLFSTHDIPYALDLCDQIVVIQEGKTQSNTPQALIDQGIINRLFPSENVGFNLESRTFFIR